MPKTKLQKLIAQCESNRQTNGFYPQDIVDQVFETALDYEDWNNGEAPPRRKELALSNPSAKTSGKVKK